MGFDFCMWRDLQQTGDERNWDEIVLTRSSVYAAGCGCSIASATRRPRATATFGEMTDNWNVAWQSYFLLFQRAALVHSAFREFWRTVENHTDRIQVIQSYEVGPSSRLREEGLRG